MSEDNGAAYHVVIHGRVQGVAFRYTAVKKALQLGLTGWVRNASDGTVETQFEGTTNQTADFLRWLHHGPPGARVLRVDENKIPPTGFYKTFSIGHL